MTAKGPSDLNSLTEDERLVYDTMIEAGLCFYTCDENHATDRCHPAAMDMARRVVANYGGGKSSLPRG